MKRYLFLLIIIVLSLSSSWVLSSANHVPISSKKQGALSSQPKTAAQPEKERVMVIGGSVAHGWKATHSYGYLQRAFHALTEHTANDYVYYDRTIVGTDGSQLATLYKGRYQKWLAVVKPQVVVISWGLLNDSYTKVTDAQFELRLRDEINEALSSHAVVLIVTPPVTKASYTQYKIREPMYVRDEFKVVKQLHRPNVYLFDVFDEMKSYLTAHHQTYVPYMGDGWHPNTAGHILGGELLYNAMVKQFGDKPIVYSSSVS